MKLARPSAEKWAATLVEERRRLHEDHEALRERERNLRDYESRLRLLQAEIESVRSAAAGPAAPAFRAPGFPRSSSGEDPALQGAWEKVHRAREILEAEQRNMRDDRIAIRDLEAQVKQREAAVAERELCLTEREALIVAAMPVPGSSADEAAMSAVSRLTRAPFTLARSVFGLRK